MGGDLSKQPAYRNTPCKTPYSMPNTDLMFNNAFFIGCHPFITEKQKKQIVEAFESFFLYKKLKI